MSELLQIVEQITPELGEAEGEPTPLEGGITNRNYLVTLGGKRYVIRVPGKDTDLSGSTAAESATPTSARPRSGSPRVWRRC